MASQSFLNIYVLGSGIHHNSELALMLLEHTQLDL